ncbi:MAG: hypothetical protein KGH69_00790 [Candidatus Micrarchaeota archaeon]|nr:hypothetical protein [Candidatus Micrarchaeota archaeon]
MMFGLLLQSSTVYQNYCTFGGINTNDWVGICTLVIMVLLMIGGAIYAISSILPAAMRERLKGGAKTEIFQALLGAIIVAVVVAFAMTACSIAQTITSSTTTHIFSGVQYSDPIVFALAYMRDLVFTKALALFSQIYSETISLVLWGNVLGAIAEFTFGTAQFATGNIQISLSEDIVGVFFGFSGVMSGAYTTLLIVTFGILYILYIFLVIIQQTALTVLLPLAIVMRSLPFMGPRLRETADSFLAIAIAFYYIFPMAIILNNFIVSWLYTSCSTGAELCNPYVQYAEPYNLGNIDITNLFKSDSVVHLGTLGINLPFTYFGQGLTGLGGFGNEFTSGFTAMVALPNLIFQYGYLTAEYIFEGIVLMGLAILITVGFAQGLSKALGSASRIIGSGPIWGGGGS